MTADELESLLAKATPGHWSWDGYAAIHTCGKLDVLALRWGYYDDCSLVLSNEDAAVICALRNAGPQLVAALRLAEAALGYDEGGSATDLARAGPQYDRALVAYREART